MALYTEHDIAQELAAQLPDTDLGVTNAFVHENTAEFVIFRLDNGQEFALTVQWWGGTRA